MKILPIGFLVICLNFVGCSSVRHAEQIDMRNYLNDRRHEVTQTGSDKTITLNQDFIFERHKSDDEENAQVRTLKSGTYRNVSGSKDYLFFKPDINGLVEVKREGKIALSERVDWGIAVSSTTSTPSFIYSLWGPKVVMEMWKINVNDFSYTGERTWERNY